MSDPANLAAASLVRRFDAAPVTAPAAAPDAGAAIPDSAREARLRASAVRFEAAFLAEMLRHSGLAKMPASFNGGAGEAAFSGTLIQEYATRISESGGVGIAEGIFKALLDRSAE